MNNKLLGQIIDSSISIIRALHAGLFKAYIYNTEGKEQYRIVIREQTNDGAVNIDFMYSDKEKMEQDFNSLLSKLNENNQQN